MSSTLLQETESRGFCFFKDLFFIFFHFYYLTVVDLCRFTWAFSPCSEQGLFFVAEHGFLIAVAFLFVEHRL